MDFGSHHDKDYEFWKAVLFTAECKFYIFGRDCHEKQNAQMKLENLTPTVKHGGESIIILGSMASAGLSNFDFYKVLLKF